MKSIVQAGADPVSHPLLGFIPAGKIVTVPLAPAVVVKLLGSQAAQVHVTQAPDTFPSTSPVASTLRASARVASDGTVQAGSTGVLSVSKTATGTYSITLPAALINPLANVFATAVALASPLDDVTPPTATAVASVVDSSHVLVTTTNPSTGAAADSAFSFALLDFT